MKIYSNMNICHLFVTHGFYIKISHSLSKYHSRQAHIQCNSKYDNKSYQVAVIIQYNMGRVMWIYTCSKFDICCAYCLNG